MGRQFDPSMANGTRHLLGALEVFREVSLAMFVRGLLGGEGVGGVKLHRRAARHRERVGILTRC